jgi:SAM-dependent methyltransferase
MPGPRDDQHSESARVVREWGRVYDAHPDAFSIRRPERIDRLARRDLPRLLARLCPGGGAAILEAGCGSGQDSLFLASLGHHVVALDAHASAIGALTRARDTYTRAHGRHVDLTIVQGDFMSPPLQPASFDIVFNSGVLEHLSPGLRRDAVKAMAAMAKPGGHVVLVVPNAHHPLNGVWSWLIHHGTDHGAFDLDELPVAFDELREDLQRAECEVVDTRGIDPWRTVELYPSWLPLRALARVYERVDPFPATARRLIATRLVAVGRQQT